MNNAEKVRILNQIAQIQRMEPGKISPVVFKNRPADAGPYFKVQRWENGKNHTRHVPPEQLALLQEAVAGYARFRALTEEYAQGVIAETREELSELSAEVKKKARPARRFAGRKSRRSSK